VFGSATGNVRPAPPRAPDAARIRNVLFHLFPYRIQNFFLFSPVMLMQFIYYCSSLLVKEWVSHTRILSCATMLRIRAILARTRLRPKPTSVKFQILLVHNLTKYQCVTGTDKTFNLFSPDPNHLWPAIPVPKYIHIRIIPLYVTGTDFRDSFLHNR
jgi:hypothetical protein